MDGHFTNPSLDAHHPLLLYGLSEEKIRSSVELLASFLLFV